MADEFIELDSAWSWVVLAACMLGTTGMGSSYVLFGLLYKDLIQEFQSSSAAVGWIGSLFVGCGNIMGPIFGLVLERFGCRVVCMFGSFICSAGFFLSFFAGNVFYLYISYGILAGMGMCMIVTTCYINSMRHFGRKRPLAGALVSVGFSFGTVLIGPAMAYILEMHSWRGSLVIFSCLIMQMFPAAYFAFKPQYRVSNVRRASQLSTGNHTDPENLPHRSQEGTAQERDGRNIEMDLYSLSDLATTDATYTVNDQTNKASDTTHEPMRKAKSSININLPNSLKNEQSGTIDSNEIWFKKCQSLNNIRASSPLTIFDVAKNCTYSCNIVTNLDKKLFEHDALETCNLAAIDSNQFKKESFREILSDATVMFYLLGLLFMYVGVQVYLNHFPSRALAFGVDRGLVNYLPTTYGAVAGFTKIMSGFLVNRPNANRLLIFSLAVLGFGASLLLLPFYTTYPLMQLHGSQCGLFTGFIFSMYQTLMVDLKGVSNVTKTTPMANFCFGVASVIGTPAAGFLYDQTNDYNVTFLTTGGIVLVGSLWCFVALFVDARKKKKIKNSVEC
ncbi:hypothetical protein HELRODRAFT_194684 [Helobdella robusta]|uniref:Major facilitator superfamily (MFS) profile domain-containing protein n=1 Tax=Helobdella robusta TaxID=6412 RepID=T1FWB3_HELRO|nr:hypothetical protein HELRODRAFT_194684 [Helobdella robusta]ESN90131.1 hypothetical protein HELRODRAFT_194684 [Helobdella robusta]